MIKTTLPTLTREYDEENDEIIDQRGEIEVIIDTSIAAEELWEKKFPKEAEKEDFMTYVDRIKNVNNGSLKGDLISKLKVIYCFIESKDIPTFIDFERMFDVTAQSYYEELTNKLNKVFTRILSDSTVTPKN